MMRDWLLALLVFLLGVFGLNIWPGYPWVVVVVLLSAYSVGRGISLFLQWRTARRWLRRRCDAPPPNGGFR